MTSAAFILGVLPLALAVGAGAEMRRTLGIAVFSGMLGVTLFGILLTPVFYYVVVRLFGQRSPMPAASGQHRNEHPIATKRETHPTAVQLPPASVAVER